MKNFLLTSLLAGAVAFGASAATETFNFSYCTPASQIKLSNLGAIGSSTVQKYGAAIQLDAPYYKGMKLLKIDAYINADAAALKNMSGFQLFMSNRLTTGTPSIMAEDVTPTPTTLAGDNLAVMSYTFDEPYELDGNSFYVGYYLNINKVAGTAERYPVLLDKSVTNQPKSFFYYDPTAVGENEWSEFSYVEGAAVIYLTIQREEETFCIGVGNPETAFGEKGIQANVVLPVVNLGKAPVDEITYSYSIAGAPATTATVSIDQALAPSVSNVEYLLLPLEAVDQTGEYNVELSVTKVNGNTNRSTASSASFTLEVWPYFPKKRALIEEYTSVACGYCPRGFAAMEYISEEYPEDAVVICYHTQYSQEYEPMMVTRTLPFTDANFNGLPSSALDRTYCLDPYYGTSNNPLGILDNLNAQLKMRSVADINIESVEVVDSIITVNSSVTFMKGVEDDLYRIGYVLSCDGLFSTDRSWGQVNYFSKDKNYANAPLMEMFYNGTPTMYGLTFNDVAINTNAMTGILNSIKGVVADTPIMNEYSFDVRDVRNVNNGSLNPYLHIQNMRVNAFVINKRSGAVENACSFPVGKVYNAVEGIEADAAAGAPVFYNLQGQKVANPDKGIYIKVEGGKASKVILTK